MNHINCSEPTVLTVNPESTSLPPNGLPPVVLLRALWRSSDLHHQIGLLERRGAPAPKFRNVPAESAEGGAARALAASEAGMEAYFACAEYISTASRTSSNVSGACGFWMDFDCGLGKAAAGKGYADKHEVRSALVNFGARTGLPSPTHIVDSGGGLHAYWVVDAVVSREDWVAHALKLKALAQVCELLADPSRTADISSVLRVPGTWNYKYVPPRVVTLEAAADRPIECDAMLQAIRDAHDRLCPTTATTQLVQPVDNDGGGAARQAQSLAGPPDFDRLTSALRALDPDCDDETWKLRRLASLALEAAKHPQLAGDLERLARSWSSGDLRGQPSIAWTTPGTSNGVTGEAEFDKAWRRFQRDGYTGSPNTVSTIFRDAKEAGWIDLPEARAVVPTLGSVEIVDSVEQANVVLLAMLDRVKDGDVGAPLEPGCVAAMALLQQHNKADYQRFRGQLKVANRRVSLSELDQAVGYEVASKSPAQTHHGYAADVIARLTVDGWKPVAHEGTLYVVEPSRNIWVRKGLNQLRTMIAEIHDNNPNCTRQTDYAGIAQHAMSLAGDDEFFAGAAIGMACPDGFYRIVDEVAQVEALSPAHRQRVLIEVTPCEQATPLFDEFLHETFKSDTEGEECEKIKLVQEIAGAIMLGLMHRYQKAVLFYDPFGRAGKGTLESIFRQLVPKEFVTAISPFKWDQEYHLVMLAGARLNVVGELPDGQSIPGATFKSVIGGDLLTGRNPTQKPVSFKNEAAHLFMSNHMISSKDQSEAFFARWLIVEFPNSRLVSGLPLDPMLATRIIEKELPGIAHWALEGAARLLGNQRFSTSCVHDRLMQIWRRGNSSLHEFLDDSCELGTDHTVRRAALYKSYVHWCGENGRKPFAKARVKELLEHNATLGIRLATLNGHEMFRGVRLKPVEDSDLDI